MSKKNRQATQRTSTSHAADVRPLLHGPPDAATRRWIRWFIGAFLLVNLLAPLKWYLGQAIGADVDERFAWRMFSSNSMQRCQVELWETIAVKGQVVRRPVPLETVMQPAWAKILYTFHQPALVARILRNHCRQTEAQSVELLRTGNWPDGSPVEPFIMRVVCDKE
jgi:hypothetical protein